MKRERDTLVPLIQGGRMNILQLVNRQSQKGKGKERLRESSLEQNCHCESGRTALSCRSCGTVNQCQIICLMARDLQD